MRRLLDGLYRLSAALATMFLVLIAVLISAQIVGRWLNILIPSADDIAGYCMAASAFLGLAPTLRAGAHIRIGLVSDLLGARGRQLLQSATALLGVTLFAMLAYHTVSQNVWTFRNGDMSTGILAIPVWLPQLGMSAGILIMLVALVDTLLETLAGRPLAEAETKEETLLKQNF